MNDVVFIVVGALHFGIFLLVLLGLLKGFVFFYNLHEFQIFICKLSRKSIYWLEPYKISLIFDKFELNLLHLPGFCLFIRFTLSSLTFALFYVRKLLVDLALF